MAMFAVPGECAFNEIDPSPSPRRHVIETICDVIPTKESVNAPEQAQEPELQPSSSVPRESAATPAMDLVLKPVRVATSKPAQQTYLNTILFFITSTILLGFAVVAYGLFYFNYVPQIGIERVIHLQYGDGPHPYGITSLDSSIISQQPYDITLTLHVPRSPPNLATGNFMLSLSLLSKTYKPPLPSTTPPSPLLPAALSMGLTSEDIIFSSRRPAILTYSSRLVSLSSRLTALPLYILGLRSESETLTIPMAESASFPKGWKNAPAYIMLELQPKQGQEVQVYNVRVHFKARFGGLRWLMYNHRFISFVAFTSSFWVSEVLFTGLGWILLRHLFTPEEGKKVKGEIKGEDTDASTAIKMEEEDSGEEPDLSDTPRTFPTYGRQAPLRYTPKIKDEDSEEYVLDDTAIQPLVAEADDEDDLEGVGFGSTRGGRTDSGLGTSFSEGGKRSGLARRRSRGGR